MFDFLSDKWFEMVEEQAKKAGDLKLFSARQEIRLSVEMEDGVSFHLQDGLIHKGKDEDAQTRISIPKEMLADLFTDMSTATVLKAFIDGDIEVFGDMSQLVALQNARISEEQKEFFLKIVSKTKV